jgi:hypothetical protein
MAIHCTMPAALPAVMWRDSGERRREGCKRAKWTPSHGGMERCRTVQPGLRSLEIPTPLHLSCVACLVHYTT